MASSLDSSLVDKLLPMADRLRGTLLPKFGVAQYVVKLVSRKWDGEERGAGNFVDVETTLTPVPLVEVSAPPGWRYDLRPQGREEESLLRLTGISLANYQEDDLTGGPSIPIDVQRFWLLTDAHGQAVRSRAYVLAAPPVADRLKTIGWVVYLRRAEGVAPGLAW